MKKFFQKKGRWFAYFLYCLLVVAVLLYVRFPSALCKDYFEAMANGRNNGMELSIRELHPVFPPGLVLKGAKLTSEEVPESPLFYLKSITIRPGWMPFLFGNGAYYFTAEAYGGQLEGSVSFKMGHSGACAASLRIEHVRMQQVALLSHLAKIRFKGDLNGNILFKGRLDQMIGGEGTAKLSVFGGNVKLEAPFPGIDSIDFDRLAVNMGLGNRRVRMVRVDLEGNTIRGALSGTINLAQDLSRSRLNLKGVLEPLEGFAAGNRGMLELFRQKTGSMKRSFTIQGTLGAPKFSFS